ncbi:MAG: DUF5671 domain-containing protein [Patescibacteria group bacterium]
MDHPKTTPKDVFSYLLMIVTLYIGVVSFIALLFQYVNVLFPDALSFHYESASDIIRRSSASLIVSWPVFLLMSVLIAKEEKKEPEQREIKIRKWLLYLTLFISAITIIVDLITLVYNFLGGELTMRFFLKTLAVLLVSAGVFGYYLWEIRRESRNASLLPKMLAWSVSAVLLVSIIAGFFIIGTPKEQRARRFDAERIGHLQMAQNEIVNFWINKKTLPLALSDLTNSISGFAAPVDPETGIPYQYRIIGPLEFELCGTFFASSTGKEEQYAYAPRMAYPFDSYQQNWAHGEGRTCFTRVIDPDRYKEQMPPVKY